MNNRKYLLIYILKLKLETVVVRVPLAVAAARKKTRNSSYTVINRGAVRVFRALAVSVKSLGAARGMQGMGIV